MDTSPFANGAAYMRGRFVPIAQASVAVTDWGNDRPRPLSLRLKEAYWCRHEEGWHRTPVRKLEPVAAE